MDEREAIALVSEPVGEPVSIVEPILRGLEDAYGFIERLCEAQSAAEVNQVITDCRPEVRKLIAAMRNAKAADLGSSRRAPPSRARTADEQVSFEDDDLLCAQALNEWFVRHASMLPQVRSFREKVLGGSPTSTHELLEGARLATERFPGDSRPGLSGKEREEVIGRFMAEHPTPVERLLTEKEAYEFLSSPATCHLSLDQFREWGIPVVGHKAHLGVPIGRYHRSDFGKHDGLSVDLTFEPAGETYRIRAPRSWTVDGFKVIPGKDAPRFPADRWRAKSTHEAVLATAIRNPDLLKHWASDLANEEPRMDRIRLRLRDNDLVLPVQRNVHLPFEGILLYPGTRGHVSKVRVWPGSVLDDLRDIGDQLAKEYHWHEAQATWFVLTGKPPIIRPLYTSTTTRHGGKFTDAIVNLEVLPWVSWRTVLRLYRQIQSGLRVRETRKQPDARAIEVFRLVTREAGAEVKDSNQWASLLGKWLREHPAEATLTSPSRLRQYYNRAKKALLLRDYEAAQRRRSG